MIRSKEKLLKKFDKLIQNIRCISSETNSTPRNTGFYLLQNFFHKFKIKYLLFNAEPRISNEYIFLDNDPIIHDTESLSSSLISTSQQSFTQNEHSSHYIEPYESLSHLNISINSIESIDLSSTPKIVETNKVDHQLEEINKDVFDVNFLNRILCIIINYQIYFSLKQLNDFWRIVENSDGL